MVDSGTGRFTMTMEVLEHLLTEAIKNQWPKIVIIVVAIIFTAIILDLFLKKWSQRRIESEKEMEIRKRLESMGA